MLGLDDDLDALAADLGLQLARRALCDGATVVDDDDVVGELIGLFEVLGGQQQRGAGGDELADDVPEAEAAAGIEPGGGLVEEQHRRRRDQRHREVEPAAHAAGVGLDAAVGGVGEVEALEQLAGPSRGRLPAEAVEPPDHVEVLVAGEDLVDGGELARTGRCVGGPRPDRSRTDTPATTASPSSGSSSVVRIDTAVVLPAPLGPSRPSTVPSGTVRSSPARACTEPNRLASPVAMIASVTPDTIGVRDDRPMRISRAGRSTGTHPGARSAQLRVSVQAVVALDDVGDQLDGGDVGGAHDQTGRRPPAPTPRSARGCARAAR